VRAPKSALHEGKGVTSLVTPCTPTGIRQLETLESLDLSDNAISSIDVAREIPISCTSLQLTGCRLTGVFPCGLAELPNLQLLYIGANRCVPPTLGNADLRLSGPPLFAWLRRDGRCPQPSGLGVCYKPTAVLSKTIGCRLQPAWYKKGTNNKP